MPVSVMTFISFDEPPKVEFFSTEEEALNAPYDRATARYLAWLDARQINGISVLRIDEEKGKKMTEEPKRREPVGVGEWPEKPIIASKSPANAGKQKHLDALYALAEQGKWEEVAGYPTAGQNTYAIQVRRFKERLLAYHRYHTKPTGS